MALPPKGDPRRPLHLAIRSTRLLGGLFVALGLFSLAPILLSLRGSSTRGLAIYLSAGAMMYFVPGLLYILCAIYLRRRQLWAVVAGIVLASIQLLFVLLGVVGVSVGLMNSGGEVPQFVYVILGLIGLVVLALAQLIYHLARSFEGIKHPAPGEEARGFEPLPVAHPAAGGPDVAPPAR